MKKLMALILLSIALVGCGPKVSPDQFYRENTSIHVVNQQFAQSERKCSWTSSGQSLECCIQSQMAAKGFSFKGSTETTQCDN